MRREIQETENSRLEIQIILDSKKNPMERNKLGQFATPPDFAKSIIYYVLDNYFPNKQKIRFLEPALGTGSFYSALLSTVDHQRIDSATGIEYDAQFFAAAKKLWGNEGLQVVNADFMAWRSNKLFNLIVTNPPYVRHHHIDEELKLAYKTRCSELAGFEISGLSGLYVFFLIHSVNFMSEDGIGAWLIPSEWMNVNYGEALRRFLVSNVTLLGIHHYNISDVKFQDALVSSSVVIFKKSKPTRTNICVLSTGSDIYAPLSQKEILFSQLLHNKKWLNLFNGSIIHEPDNLMPKLGDYFTIKRGIATGSNHFFVKPKDEFDKLGISSNFLKPIFPPSRVIKSSVIESDSDGYPALLMKLALLDTNLPIDNIKQKHLKLYSYLTSDIAIDISTKYLASRRTPWYSQEKRPYAPFLCTYMGRNGSNKRIFRFFYNKSKATATNGYLLLIPHPFLSALLENHPEMYLSILDFLNSIPDEDLVSKGRNYGGGLYKIEPKELANVDASFIAQILGLPSHLKSQQLSLAL
jgi:predicted RNA methylase